MEGATDDTTGVSHIDGIDYKRQVVYLYYVTVRSAAAVLPPLAYFLLLIFLM